MVSNAVMEDEQARLNAQIEALKKANKDLRKVWRDVRIVRAYGRLVLSSRSSKP